MKINKYLLLSLLVITGKGFAAGQMHQGQMMSGMQTRFVEPVAVEEKLVLINETNQKLAVAHEGKQLAVLNRQGGQAKIGLLNLRELTLTNQDTGDSVTIAEVTIKGNGKKEHSLEEAINQGFHKIHLKQANGEIKAIVDATVANKVNGHAAKVASSHGQTFPAERGVSAPVATSAMAQAY